MLTVQIRHRLTTDDVVDLVTYLLVGSGLSLPTRKDVVLRMVRDEIELNGRRGILTMRGNRRDGLLSDELEMRVRVLGRIEQLFPEWLAKKRW
jgi:hypothetical protein